MATFGGYGCEDPLALARECASATPPIPTDRWWGRANRFDVPLGREPGRGWLLLKKSALDAIAPTADHALRFVGADPAHVRTLSPITFLHAECVAPGSAADGGAVYLIEVVDRRYHLARRPISASYNLLGPGGTDYLADTLNAGVAWTWQEVVDDLCAACGLAALALPFAPDGAPESLAFWAPCSAWDALCDVLDRLACAVEYDPEADAFAIVRLGAADATSVAAQAALAGAALWDGYSAEAVRGWRPEKVRVVFPRLPAGGTSPVYTEDVTLAAVAGVVAGTVVQLADDLVARGATGAPSNAAALATRAAERAADWLRKRAGYERRLVRVYRDFRAGADLLGSTVGRVSYDDRGGPFATALRSEPDGNLERWRPGVGRMLPWGSEPVATDDCTGTAWLSALRSTDCLQVTIPGTDEIVALTSIDGGTTFTSGSSTVTICDEEYTVRLTPGSETLQLIPYGGSGSGSGTEETDCCDDPIPTTGYVVVIPPADGYTGDCADLDGEVSLTLALVEPGHWATSDGFLGGFDAHIQCESGVWTAWIDTDPQIDGTDVLGVCPEDVEGGYAVVFADFTGSGGVPCTGTFGLEFVLEP